MNTWCDEHETRYPCDQCNEDFAKLDILDLMRGNYTYVEASGPQLLVVKTRGMMSKGYDPLGPPNVLVVHSASQGMHNFGELTTRNTIRWHQFMVKRKATKDA